MIRTRDDRRSLPALGYDPGPADGIRGLKTIAAIKEFQNDYGLVGDGIAGKQTRTVLKQAVTLPTSFIQF